MIRWASSQWPDDTCMPPARGITKLNGISVAAAFELSYAHLDDASARVFRLLPVNLGPDISTATAAILAGLATTDTRRVLAGLARAHLVETAPGKRGRWRMHDLLRLYARQLSDRRAETDGRLSALGGSPGSYGNPQASMASAHGAMARLHNRSVVRSPTGVSSPACGRWTERRHSLA